MTGKLVCPIGPDTKLEADPTNQELEIYGVCVCHLDSDFKIGKLEVCRCSLPAQMELCQNEVPIVIPSGACAPLQALLRVPIDSCLWD